MGDKLLKHMEDEWGGYSKMPDDIFENLVFAMVQESSIIHLAKKANSQNYTLGMAFLCSASTQESISRWKLSEEEVQWIDRVAINWLKSQ